MVSLWKESAHYFVPMRIWVPATVIGFIIDQKALTIIRLKSQDLWTISNLETKQNTKTRRVSSVSNLNLYWKASDVLLWFDLQLCCAHESATHNPGWGFFLLFMFFLQCESKGNSQIWPGLWVWQYCNLNLNKFATNQNNIFC